MAIALGSQAGTSTFVLKRSVINEEFRGVVVDLEQRDLLKDGERVMNAKGKPRQELVVHMLVMSSTMPVSLKGEQHTPEADEPVRAILKGGAFGQWIDAAKNLPGGQVNVGDLVWMNSTHAETYDISGRKIGQYSTQAEIEEHFRARKTGTVGMRGDLKLHRDDVKYAEWVAKAEQAWHERQSAKREPIPVGGNAAPAHDHDEEPW